MTRIDATEKAIELIKILQQKHGDLMFYQAGVVVKERNRNALKRRFYQRLGDICIGSIENTEFWVDKDLFEYWKHALYFRCN
jgi:uncharacterized protein (DUF779 family)